MPKERSKPLVSVVIPTFNARKFLTETVKSALDQTYKNVELLVIDDGSTDGTEDLPILKDSRVHYFKISHTGGPATPRNVGVQNAKGDLIAFLDSDDIWLPQKLEKQVSFMEKDGVDFVSSDAKVIDEQGRITGESYVGKERVSSGGVFAQLYVGNFIINSSVLVKKSCFGQVGLFDPQMGPSMGFEDYDLWLRVTAKFQLGFMREPLLLYRQRKGSLSDTSSVEDLERGLAVVKKNFKSACSIVGAEAKMRPFSLCRALAIRYKREDYLRYLKYKSLAFWYFPLGVGSLRELWPEAKSVIKL